MDDFKAKEVGTYLN